MERIITRVRPSVRVPLASTFVHVAIPQLHQTHPGLEVLLEVDYTHTADPADGGATGARSLRGIDNAAYYLIAPGGEVVEEPGAPVRALTD